MWNGAVLASFDNETSAREAITKVDDDEVVVLYIDREIASSSFRDSDEPAKHLA